ncbi:HAD-IC family P-type ATPase [Haloechinothrix salitolerans]|uniref:Cation-translocating P-type ATPase n=1 Tax=Haloechinothrix salitolerans TaxID=926830 RepID=A0ABW2BYQ0_9PSEU
MTATTGPVAAHRSSPDDVVAELGTDTATGLTAEQVRDLRERYGPNTLPRHRGRGLFRRWLDQFTNPLVIVLIAASAVTIAIGHYVDAGVIAAVVLLNAIVGFVQENKARQALDAISDLVRMDCHVLRDGRRMVVPSEELVPGDMVLLDAGDRVPADARVVAAHDLKCDESALTGESRPVRKSSDVVAGDVPLAERTNMVFSGTMVTHGTGTAVVVATGEATEIGMVRGLVASATAPLTPLTRKLALFSKQLTAVIMAIAAVTFAVGMLRGSAATDMFIAAVALAVGAIPEGLPAAVTVVLAIGVVRMARRHAIVRHLPAVETLGSTTVICSDKTGTITANAMTVAEVVAGGEFYRVSGTGFAPDGTVNHAERPIHPERHPALMACLETGVLCNDAELRRGDDGWQPVGDPTEVALLTVAAKAGLNFTDLRRQQRRIDVLPFESSRRMMATLHEQQGGTVTGHVKGALEQVLRMCRDALDADGAVVPLDASAVQAAAHGLATSGLRVLAFARYQPPEDVRRIDEAELPGTLTLLGLVAMADLPREGVGDAVRACLDAGVRVTMITGDHAETARAVAAKVGLGAATGPVVVTGAELAATSGADFDHVAASADVFARVSPEQKLRLVESLQRAGHVVAMTGDGVNDAPALRRADIGVAMGDIGTEVARDAADMVLTDDNFSSIEAAVEEGRSVFDNLRKFIAWTLPTNIGEGLVIVAAVLLGTALPILPVQILWINLTTAGFLGLTLAFEPKEAGIMRRTPRPPSKPLLTGGLIRRILLVSVVLVVGAFGVFELQLAAGMAEPVARTAAINVFVFAEMAFLISCRSFDRMLPGTRNRWLFAGIATMTALQLAMTYWSVMHLLFHTAPLDVSGWLMVLAVAAATYVLVEVDKAIWRRGDRRAEYTTG